MSWWNQLAAIGTKYNKSLNVKLLSHLSSQNIFQASLKALPLLSNTIGDMNKNSISTSAALLMSAPVKKKRRSDPMLDRKRDEKRLRKYKKALNKMEKKARISKPLIELEVDPNVYGGDMQLKRERVLPTLTSDQMEEKNETHELLKKEWARFAVKRHIKELKLVDSVMIHRQIALEELRKESNELYAQAIKPELTILKDGSKTFYKAVGPTSSPPIRKEFEEGNEEDWLVDGHYKEVTQSFQIQYGDMKSYLSQLLYRGRAKKKSTDEE